MTHVNEQTQLKKTKTDCLYLQYYTCFTIMIHVHRLNSKSARHKNLRLSKFKIKQPLSDSEDAVLLQTMSIVLCNVKSHYLLLLPLLLIKMIHKFVCCWHILCLTYICPTLFSGFFMTYLTILFSVYTLLVFLAFWFVCV